MTWGHLLFAVMTTGYAQGAHVTWLPKGSHMGKHLWGQRFRYVPQLESLERRLVFDAVSVGYGGINAQYLVGAHIGLATQS
jgi:hypothetical protein